MAILRFQVNLKSDSLVAQDDIVNVWHGITVGETSVATAATTFTGWLSTFYQTMDTYLSSTLTNTGHTVKVYDLGDVEPRAPVLETVITGMAVSTGTLPREVALTLSFQGTKLSGTPQARRRGRIYIGPMASSVADATTGRPNATVLTALQGAAAALLASSDASSEVKWCIYSPTTGLTTLVDNGWVDDEWDTQRRRGVEAIGRSVF